MEIAPEDQRPTGRNMQINFPCDALLTAKWLEKQIARKMIM